MSEICIANYYRPKEFILSFDIAKKHDFFSIELFRDVPITKVDKDGKEVVFRYLDWVRSIKGQDMPYPDMCKMVATMLESRVLKDKTVLLIDATGVGEPVRDMLTDLGVKGIVPIVATGGKNVSVSYKASQRRFSSKDSSLRSSPEYNVPKQDMIASAQIFMQQGKVRIAPNCGDADGIKRQLMGFVGAFNKSGTLSAEAKNDSTHDDHISAFLMATWFQSQMTKGARRDMPISEYGVNKNKSDYNVLDYITRTR